MSLKWFHIFFITSAALLSVLVAMWGFSVGSPLFAVLSLAAGALLVVYQSRFIRKAKKIGLK